jgi:squalene synthase HpnD
VTDLTAPASATKQELADQIRELVKASGTSFYMAMRILPPPRRDAMYAIYAFCREVDDIADDDASPGPEKIRRLDAWRREIDALYAGKPRMLVSRALADPVRKFKLNRDDFLAIIDGMEMDAKEDIRAPSMADLDLYCARVASAVGMLSVRAFGVISHAADNVAQALGRALQLTNILRDIAEDAERGRLYLPRELLDKHEIPTDSIQSVLMHENLPALCEELAKVAEHYFDEAARAMAECPPKAMRPAAVMGATYRAVLDRLIARGWRDIYTPVSVPKHTKLWLALRHGLL